MGAGAENVDCEVAVEAQHPVAGRKAFLAQNAVCLGAPSMPLGSALVSPVVGGVVDGQEDEVGLFAAFALWCAAWAVGSQAFDFQSMTFTSTVFSDLFNMAESVLPDDLPIPFLVCVGHDRIISLPVDKPWVIGDES